MTQLQEPVYWQHHLNMIAYSTEILKPFVVQFNLQAVMSLSDEEEWF